MSYRELTTQHRPKKFNQVIGQSEKFLIQELVKTPEQFPPLLIFCGPSGVGKTTLARIVAAALNCENRQEDGNPCTKCVSCEAVRDNSHPNVEECDAATDGGVDALRELHNKALLRASGVKVFIIDEAQSISAQGWNSLLKLFEEPPMNTAFILLTSEPRKIPVKIRTRGIRFNLNQVAPKEIQDYLILLVEYLKVSIDEDDISVIVDNCSGSVRDALMMLEQTIISKKPASEQFGVNDLSLPVLYSLMSRDSVKVFELMDRWHGQVNDPQTILGMLAVSLEKVLFIRHKVPVFAAHKSAKYLTAFAAAFDDSTLSAFLELISDWLYRVHTKGQLIVFTASMVKLLNGPTKLPDMSSNGDKAEVKAISPSDIKAKLASL